VKTNRATGFACAFAIALIAACSGTQGVTEYGPDGSVVEGGNTTTPSVDAGRDAVMIITNNPDTGIVSTPDTGIVSTPDTGTSTSDTGASTGSSSGADTGAPPPASDSGGGGMCPSTCTTDQECQSACPAIAGALNCCDAVTMACFQSASTACPDQGSTGGGGDGGSGGDDGGGGGY
jgi:hypothetical protein